MEIGIGLPNAVAGVDRAGIVDWARRAETAGFSSLGTIDRIAFPNYEALFYFSLGNQAEEDARHGLGHYHAFLGEYAEQIVEGAAKDKGTLQSYVSAFEAAGADEVICFPSSSDPAQVELLADAVL